MKAGGQVIDHFPESKLGCTFRSEPNIGGCTVKRAVVGLAISVVVSTAWANRAAAADGAQGAPTGEIILSITSGGSDAEIDLRPSDRQPPIKITANPGGVFGSRGDFKLPTEEIKSRSALDGTGLHYMKSVSWRGKVIVLTVPAGQYELVKVTASDQGGGVVIGGAYISFVHRTGEEMNFPVKVEAGRATYIGEFKTLYLAKKNIIGIEGWYGFRYVVSDQSIRDIPIARTKSPQIGPVDISIPPVDDLHQNWIGSEP